MGPDLSASGVSEAIQIVARASYSGFTIFVAITPPSVESRTTASSSHLYRRIAASGRSSGDLGGASVGSLPHPCPAGIGGCTVPAGTRLNDAASSAMELHSL